MSQSSPSQAQSQPSSSSAALESTSADPILPGPPPPFGSDALRSLFLLQPDIYFLNHGSFGAAPRCVLEAQSAWRAQMELEPVRFMVRELPSALRAAAAHLAQYIGAAAGEDVVFVNNATSGVNAVLHSIDFRPGDEILLNTQTYNAVKQAITFTCRRTGAVAVVREAPFPLHDEDAFVRAILSGLSDRTRLVIFDHVTSPTAYVTPLERLVPACRARGAHVLVDGAHALGMLPLDMQALEALGVDYYTGNAHKWLCAPKGCAFLWVRRALQAAVHPPVISHFLDAGFTAEFDWAGTWDPSAYLACTAALRFRAFLGGDAAVMRHNHALAVAAAERLAAAWHTELAAPPARCGSMALVRCPLPRRAATKPEADRLHDQLLDEFRIEVPVMALPGWTSLWIRISAQVYNRMDDYDALAHAVLTLQARDEQQALPSAAL